MKMDENKKIFPIFLEKSSIIENEESPGYTQSIVEEIKKTLTKFITKSSMIENEEEKKKKTRQAFERIKQYMEETE